VFYNYRTFFLIYSSEDYVDMAKQKVSRRAISSGPIFAPHPAQHHHEFFPAHHHLVTGALFTETVFLWPGLGRTLFHAIGQYDIPIIVGSTIIYAYCLPDRVPA